MTSRSPIETNNVVELIEKLRRERVTRMYEGDYINPNGPEAADLIQSLSDRIDVLDAECERAWESYRIAVDQAMANGQALADLRASLTQGGKNAG